MTVLLISPVKLQGCDEPSLARTGDTNLGQKIFICMK